MPPRIVWNASDDASPPGAKSESAQQSFCSSAALPMLLRFRSRLRATSELASARERNCRGRRTEPTRIPTLLSSYKVDDIVSSSTQSDWDSDSDYSDIESDSDSGVSSISDASSTSPRFPACPPPTAKSDVDVTRYTYQGDVTQVLSGGVMLGVSPKPHRGSLTVFSNGRSSGMARNTARRTGVSSIDSWLTLPHCEWPDTLETD
ncbi:hypothetical protein MVEN_01827700 [Mycena venus]|uniref:Uncharacterized protein n=1 Tax=Mycena venus TaxID=2733690 RepID=A0A8H7CNG7_9AGAR|nr:hypothetical protein MVEN_01827700 [Mycena venus]